MIVVSINYRLGPLGFLCLDTDEGAGNMGMLDQVMALEWVHENIHLFGGDKDRITIFGQSAGAASISHLVMSKATDLEDGTVSVWRVDHCNFICELHIIHIGTYDSPKQTSCKGSFIKNIHTFLGILTPSPFVLIPSNLSALIVSKIWIYPAFRKWLQIYNIYS